jgi:cellulose synthase (UDP-forming)
MTDAVALALNLGVLGLVLAAVPLLPRQRTWARSLVVLFTIGLWVRYLHWRVTVTAPPDLASAEGLYYLLVLAVEGVGFLSFSLFYLTLSRTADRSGEADRHEARLRALPPHRLPAVDVFLPTYNEEADVLERSIVAARALDYPRVKVWVLDDGRRDWLRDLCARKGVGYLRRPDNRHAKAGNINHALAVTDGELFVIFDADFTPYRNFLYRTVGFFFADPRVAVVQTPQHFFNPDVFQVNLGLVGSTQDNEREWYDVVLASRDAWDCASCCGSCAVFRRDAVLAVGGIPTESVTEDVLTTMRQLRHGWVTRYLNERLSMGLMPENVQSLLIQRQRWARGGLQLLFLKAGPLGPGLTWRQRLLFFQYHHLIDFPCRLMLVLLPLVYLWTGSTHVRLHSMAELLAYQGPAVLAALLLGRWLIPNARVPLLSPAIELYLSGRTFPSVLGTLLKPFGTPFRVTPKGSGNTLAGGDRVARRLISVLIGLTVAGIVFGQLTPGRFSDPVGRAVGTLWAFVSLILLGLIALCVGQKPRLRGEERFPIGRAAWLSAAGWEYACLVIDLSLTGALLGRVGGVRPGEPLRLSLPEVGILPGTVIRATGDRAAVRFAELPEATRDRLITYLYASGRGNGVAEVDPLRVLGRVLRWVVLG